MAGLDLLKAGHDECESIQHQLHHERLALEAAAALPLDPFVEIVLAVIVRQLLARLDPAPRKDENAALPVLDLAIGSAGVVDIAGGVRPALAVDRLLAGDLEQILAAAGIFLLQRDPAPGVLDDARALVDRREGIKTETGARSPDLEVERVSVEALLHRPYHYELIDSFQAVPTPLSSPCSRAAFRAHGH